MSQLWEGKLSLIVALFMQLDTLPVFEFLSPFDRLFLKISISLLVLTCLLLTFGDHSLPMVRVFNWQNQAVGADDIAFTLNFNRPMDRPRVESDLIITHLTDQDPQHQKLSIGKDLPGKVSWAGQKMLYTLSAPAPYGNSYQINLQGVTAANHLGQAIGQPMQPFTGNFTTRARIFAFIGATGESKGRLVLGSLDRQVQLLLTPANLTIQDFHFLPKGAGIIFSATTVTLDDTQIYRLSLKSLALDTLKQQTSRSLLSTPGIQSIDLASRIASSLILDNKVYQNLQFDLSTDGRYLVVQRSHRHNPLDVGLWAMNLGPGNIDKKSNRLGAFLITPDSQSIGISLPAEHSIAIISLTSRIKPLQLQSKFQQILSFTPAGNQAAMVKINGDYTRSLLMVDDQGTTKELLRIKGSILRAVFAIDGQTLYCITTEIQQDQNHTISERPMLLAIDLATAQSRRLLALQPPLQIQLSLAPDGQALMFDQQRTNNSTDSIILLLPLPTSGDGNGKSRIVQLQPFILPVSGFHSKWAP
jgi:hypothetical protein